jgi:dihydroorotate dehydrogenase electron transfer subunit
LKKRGIYEVIANEKIAKDVHKMILKGDTSYVTFPGQFINIKIDDLYLRRPISICDYDKETITIIFKVVGHGTEKMAEMGKGTKLDILTGLGNGFNKTRSGKSPLLVGGGVGTPPMYRLCKELIDEGKSPIVVLGFNSKEDVFFEDEFKKLGADVYISTVDGSYGTKGFVTDVIKDLENYTYHYACGPLPMLKALYNTAEGDGEYSFEERMGCGFGACMGCTVKVKDGFKRVCKDGPVLKKEEIVW